MNINRLLIVLSLAAVIYIVPNTSFGAALPFGGLVTVTKPCNNGLLLYVKTPIQGVQTFMWFTGNLPYLMKITPHPGQWLLGMAGTAMVPCVLAKVTIGKGRPILYHGSSL